jgi:hypothetical protein
MPKQVSAAAQEPSTALRPDEFRETLYFLDDAELRRLSEEVRQEAARDLLGDVMNALFDRIEGDEERQVRIVRLLGSSSVGILAAGRFDRAGRDPGRAGGDGQRRGAARARPLKEIRQLFGILSRPETIEQLTQTLDEHPEALQSDGSRAAPLLPAGGAGAADARGGGRWSDQT